MHGVLPEVLFLTPQFIARLFREVAYPVVLVRVADPVAVLAAIGFIIPRSTDDGKAKDADGSFRGL